MKYLISVVIGIFLLGAAFFAGSRMSLFKETKKESATVLLDRVKKVTKLIAVEGYLSEIYDYESNNLFDHPLFKKKALVRIKAKASIGYDFEKMNISFDQENQTVSISNIPDPELLSLEHDLDYYDLREGVFNIFSSEDLTEINKNAKAYIRDIALNGELYQSAEEQKDDYVEMLKFVFESAGWQVLVDDPVLID